MPDRADKEGKENLITVLVDATAMAQTESYSFHYPWGNSEQIPGTTMNEQSKQMKYETNLKQFKELLYYKKVVKNFTQGPPTHVPTGPIVRNYRAT